MRKNFSSTSSEPLMAYRTRCSPIVNNRSIAAVFASMHARHQRVYYPLTEINHFLSISLFEIPPGTEPAQ